MVIAVDADFLKHPLVIQHNDLAARPGRVQLGSECSILRFQQGEPGIGAQ